jgi:hypothetical protein
VLQIIEEEDDSSLNKSSKLKNMSANNVISKTIPSTRKQFKEDMKKVKKNKKIRHSKNDE